MKTATAFPASVRAEPNKNFFVHMLTRDIELGDAILDLLDNCVDGIVRSLRSNASGPKPYAKYYARIVLSPTSFSIENNCGGIPLELAKTKAFHMGRPPGHQDGAATVGMYGIGMKRAIFKIGEQCDVISRNGNDAFVVTISKQWLSEPTNWDLPIKKLDPKKIPNEGTTIRIGELRAEVARRFNQTKDAFVKDFATYVAQHYSIILEKGFRVSINGKEVVPIPFKLLSADLNASSKQQHLLSPYLVDAVINDVEVRIAVGFYRPIPDEAEVEAEKEQRASKDDAGWTIVCNDRVVVYRDRTRLTGWGEAGVPGYHGQFIAISGIVVMRSDDLWKLPLTTTKRGIDPSSDTYSVAKDYMREGIKYFTRFTNRWKKLPQERERLYRSSELRSLDQLFELVPDSRFGKLKAPSKGVSTTSRRYVPDLPQPINEHKDVRVSFSRPREQVRALGNEIFDDPDTAPAEVGGACFDRVLEKLVGK